MSNQALAKLAYESVDSRLRKDMKSTEPGTTVLGILQEINNLKHSWFGQYKPNYINFEKKAAFGCLANSS